MIFLVVSSLSVNISDTTGLIVFTSIDPTPTRPLGGLWRAPERPGRQTALIAALGDHAFLSKCMIDQR
jgi:hypothetical protein